MDYVDRYNVSLSMMTSVLQVFSHILSTAKSYTILQLVYLKHFSSNPLTLLVHSSPASDILSQPSSFPFLDALLLDLRAHHISSHAPGEWSPKSLESLIASVDTARRQFSRRAAKMRVAFGILQLGNKFMLDHGYNGFGWAKTKRKSGSSERMFKMMDFLLKGKLKGCVTEFGDAIK